MVFASLDLEWLSSFAISEQLSPDSVVTVVDRQGTVLTGYPDPEVWPRINSQDAPIVQRAIQMKQGPGGGDRSTDAGGYTPTPAWLGRPGTERLCADRGRRAKPCSPRRRRAQPQSAGA